MKDDLNGLDDPIVDRALYQRNRTVFQNVVIIGYLRGLFAVSLVCLLGRARNRFVEQPLTPNKRSNAKLFLP